MHPGEQVRQRRLSLGLKPSQLERLSKSLAIRLRDPRYAIPHSTLAEIEAGSLPSVYKIFALAYCLRVSDDHILDWYGIDVHVVRSAVRDRTSLEVMPQQEDSHHDFSFPFSWPDDPPPAKTALFDTGNSHGASGRSENFRYAWIGSKDHSMMDIIPAGSLVRIDIRQNKVGLFPWKSLWHRPIYFVWHQFGHSCRWCQQNGNELMIISHPASHDPNSIFRLPHEITIVGRVLSVWPSQHELSVDLPDHY